MYLRVFYLPTFQIITQFSSLILLILIMPLLHIVPDEDMSPGNLAKFKDKLAHFNWSAVYSNQDPRCAFDLFYNNYLDLYGTCFPIMGIQSLYHTRKPWLTQGLRKSIKTKNLLSKVKPNPTLNPYTLLTKII